MPAPKRRRQIWRILRSIDFDGPDGCWIWTGGIGNHGYGVASWAGRQHGAHRVIWWMFTGQPIPADHDLDHLCTNIRCVNPAHLEPTTRGENARRAHIRNPERRHANREKTHCKRGHTLADAYLINGTRVCRHCQRETRIARRVRLPSAERTHCPTGHRYSIENTYITPKGGRQCRICRREAVRRCIGKRGTRANSAAQ